MKLAQFTVPSTPNLSNSSFDMGTNSFLSGQSNFWDGANFMSLLGTVGATVGQVVAAKNGQQVIVTDAGGVPKDISSDLKMFLEEEASKNQTTSDELLKILSASIENNNSQVEPKEDNTLLYVGLGVGGLVLFGGLLYVFSKGKK